MHIQIIWGVHHEKRMKMEKLFKHMQYLPWGEVWMDERAMWYEERFTFSGKERDAETGYSYFGYRYYLSHYGIWGGVDPLSDKYPSMSPYAYCGNNPVMLVDPDGRYIEVTNNNDDTYTVKNGIANDDRNIYVVDKDGNRTGVVVGEMLTNYSFFDANDKVKKGTLIDTKDQSGEDFFNSFKNNTPSLIRYARNAKAGEKYDFKNTNGGEHTIKDIDQYRGMPFTVKGKKYYASARDIGNYTAGYFAGTSCIPYVPTMVAFDALETYSRFSWTDFKLWRVEPNVSRSAQKLGFKHGSGSLPLFVIYPHYKSSKWYESSRTLR